MPLIDCLTIDTPIVNLRTFGIGCLLALCGLNLPASAVIVAGASGGGDNSNNTTEAQYISETSTSLNVYNHVVQFGGGIFIYNGSQWILSGLMSAVAGYSGQDANTSAFGNLTMITDISTYRSAIDAAIGGTLIPEPSLATLLASIGTLAMLRRRR